jgi:hypothetical protein
MLMRNSLCSICPNEIYARRVSVYKLKLLYRQNTSSLCLSPFQVKRALYPFVLRVVENSSAAACLLTYSFILACINQACFNGGHSTRILCSREELKESSGQQKIFSPLAMFRTNATRRPKGPLIPNFT